MKWVPLSLTRINPLAQRDFKQSRADHLAANLDLENIGTPTVNFRDGHYYVIDGQHRIAALKQVGWGDQKIQCWCYNELSSAEEAEKFLSFNDAMPVSEMAKFKVGVEAGRDEETDIDRLVRAQGLRVSTDKSDGAISAVGTLRKLYTRAGPDTFCRALRLVRDTYGDPGLIAPVIDGIGLVCQRYGADLSDDLTIAKLRGVMGGVSGLLGKAQTIKRQTGNNLAHCVAAAVVEVVNSGRGGIKIPSWWVEQPPPALKAVG